MYLSALNVIQHPLELRPSFNAFAAFAFFNISIKNRHTPTLGAFSQIVLLPIQTIPLYLTLTADADIDNTRFALFRIIHRLPPIAGPGGHRPPGILCSDFLIFLFCGSILDQDLCQNIDKVLVAIPLLRRHLNHTLLGKAKLSSIVCSVALVVFVFYHVITPFDVMFVSRMKCRFFNGNSVVTIICYFQSWVNSSGAILR